jgi:hypothetical protein
VLEGFGLGDWVLWVGSGEVTAVGDVQGAEGEERGSWARSSSSPPFLTARVGAEGARLDRGSVHGMATGSGANENSDLHSETDFSRFLPTTCSIKCPQEFKFQIF